MPDDPRYQSLEAISKAAAEGCLMPCEICNTDFPDEVWRAWFAAGQAVESLAPVCKHCVDEQGDEYRWLVNQFTGCQ